MSGGWSVSQWGKHEANVIFHFLQLRGLKPQAGSIELEPTQNHPALSIPDKLNPDWCRFRTGGACCFAGDVLADEAGVTVLGVTDTSHTGPSYRPRGTPLSSAS